MRKNLLYIVVAVIVLVLGIISYYNIRNRGKTFDPRITLRQADKIPYGTSVARQLLPKLFTKTNIYYTRTYANYWDSISTYDSAQAIFIVTTEFNADNEELSILNNFVKEGNYVFVVARSFSTDAQEFFRFNYSPTSFQQIQGNNDSLELRLENSVFGAQSSYVYPGSKYESIFTKVDTPYTTVLGRSDEGYPNFIQLRLGKGSFFIHTVPLAFSNYFILHKKNVAYYSQAVSVLPQQVNKIVWNEYYLSKKRSSNREPNWLGVLMRFPAFKWALITAILTGLLYILLGMRRRQRMIPAYAKPRNESLEFVKTMGRLYFEKKDHKNLARKMGAYFLDHVRLRYKIATHELDEDFVKRLQFKSGYSQSELQYLVGFINDLEQLPAVSENQLLNFQRQLELFYQNT
jgi:hypothetical protein